MLTLAYMLTVANKGFSQQVAGLRCERGLAPAVSTLRVRLPYVGDAPVALGNDVSLEIDSGERAATVLTGTVAALRHSAAGVELFAADASWRLARLRPRRTFQNQTGADIVGALCRDAGVRSAGLEDGPTFPAYAADGALTAWEHVARIAAWSGADAFVDGDGAVRTVRREPVLADHALRWGREVVAVQAGEAEGHAGATFVAGEGPGPAGDVPGALRFTASGSPPGGPAAVRSRPALRDRDAATAASTAWARREAARRHPVLVEAFLLPAVTPGDLVEIQEAPIRVPLLHVHRVVHRLDLHGGTTALSTRRAADPDLLSSLDGLASAAAGAIGGLL